MLAVRGAQRIGVDVWLFERGAGEQLVDRPLLEFDRISVAAGGDIHQLLGQVRIAVVVDAAFGDDEAGLAVADEPSADRDRPRTYQAVQPPSTMRFAPVM